MGCFPSWGEVETALRYRAEIDGLRALAVVPVILFHAGFSAFSGGFVGVDVFFVISGYLITTIILGDLDEGRFSIARFYERRARRILPVLFVVMLACIPFSWSWFLVRDMRGFSHSLIAVVTFSSNILFWLESGYFDTSAELKPLLHTWSLAVEEQYYILFPLFLLLTWRLGRRWILVTLAVVFVLSFTAGYWGAYARPVPAFFLLPTRGWEILVGAFVAFYLHKCADREDRGPVGPVMSLIGFSLIVYAIVSFDKQTPFPSLYTLVPTIGTALIILFATKDTPIQKLLSNKVLVGIGLISYSAYLWHQPLFAFTRYLSQNKPDEILMLVLCGVTFPLAYLSWRFVECPFRLPDMVKTRTLILSAALMSSLLVTFGVIGHAKDGNVWRYTQFELEVVGDDIARDQYIWALKNKLGGAPFRPDAARKVLLVGDSHSGDLLNALHWATQGRDISFSSLLVNFGCGNLRLERERYFDNVALNIRSSCDKMNPYDNDARRRLLREADVVILASSWLQWEVNLLSESMRNLVSEYGDKFLVFGTKQVHLDIQRILHAPSDARTSLTVAPIDSAVQINASIREIIGDRFADPFDLLCDSGACPVFTDQGKLIIYDGSHLTEAGAMLMGTRYLSDERYAKFFTTGEI